MRKTLRYFVLAIVAIPAVVIGIPQASAVPLSYTGGSYSQNFDGLPTDASNAFQTITGKGPHEFSAVTNANAAKLAGWQFGNLNGSSANTEFRAQDGSLSGNTGRGVIAYGTNGSGERALGELPTSNQIITFGLALQNNTGNVLTSFTLSYIGEQWRRGDRIGPPINSLDFSYGIAADITASLTPSAGLSFSSPNQQAAPLNVALDGNDPANQSKLSLTLPVNWLPGQTLVLKWFGTEASGQDDGLGIDNLSFSAVPEPTSISLAVLGMIGAAGFCVRRRRVAV